MIITTEILYECLRSFFQKNDKNNKRTRLKEFSEKNNKDKRVKLIDLFPQNLVDGKLTLKKIDMYRLVFSFKTEDFYVRLKNINFENCIFDECDFSYLWLDPTDFEKASILDNCCVEGIHYSEKKQPSELERKKREDSWLLKMHTKYPEDYYRYPMHVRKDNADQPVYRFNYSSPNETAKYLGWKFHLSVHPTDLSKAFEIAAPIISRYGYSFKMVNSKVAFSERVKYDGAQFTIYLEENNRLLMSVEETRKMMMEVEEAFSRRNIRVGEIPDSDVSTIFKFFSLRNDKFDFDGLFIGSVLRVKEGIPGYLLPRFADSNYNPFRRDNPFAALIIDKDREFNLAKHFAKFQPQDHHEASLAYIISLCAWLNEHTRVFELPAQEKETLEKLCFSNVAQIDARIFKTKQNATPEFSAAVKLILCYLSWLNQSPFLNNHFFPLSTAYPHKNVFSAALIAMESEVIGFQNPQDKNSRNDGVSFSEFLQQKEQNDEENTVEQEGGFNKPQKLKVSKEGRIEDYLHSPHHTRPTPKP